jgi:hypothetical protein
VPSSSFSLIASEEEEIFQNGTGQQVQTPSTSQWTRPSGPQRNVVCAFRRGPRGGGAKRQLSATYKITAPVRLAFFCCILLNYHTSSDGDEETEVSWNVMAHAQKTEFVFRRNGRVHFNWHGRQFSRLLAAEVCASAVITLETLCSEVVEGYWLPTPFASIPFTSPSMCYSAPSHFNWNLLPRPPWHNWWRTFASPWRDWGRKVSVPCDNNTSWKLITGQTGRLLGND